MKKQANFIFILSIIAIFFSSCDNNELISNQLQGEWTTTYRTVNGQNDLTPGDAWRFEGCSQNNCTGSYDYPTLLGKVTASFIYIIYDNGTKFSIDFGPNSVFKDVTDANIIEHSTTKLRINFTDNGDYYEQTLERQ